MIQENRIAVWGLHPEEIGTVTSCLPAKSIAVVGVTCATDLIAMNWMAVLVNAEAMAKDDREMLYGFYQEAGDAAEILLLFGASDVPHELRRTVRVYPNVQSTGENLKYILLTAYRRKKNSENFSASLARTIRILTYIRSTPGISTATLAERLEVSPRSVQRSIETLRVAGEWIEYDTTLKGWKLGMNKSILLDDF